MKQLIDKIANNGYAEKEEFLHILDNIGGQDLQYLYNKGAEVAKKHYGNQIFIRGLIEVSSYCKNDCYYCGLRKSNIKCQRYRLTKEEILLCCDTGYKAGFRTFVMQGGEDPKFTDQLVVDIVSTIKAKYPDCAVTLSLGEKSKEQYKMYRYAGADRYLLRHETINDAHYGKLHPKTMHLKDRVQCLNNLKELGFQTGAGFMVGSPFQTNENIAEDLFFLQNFKPQMIGIGPFIPHCDTPFSDYPSGSVEKTLVCLALLRLTNPKVLLPATTALGSVDENGRIKGVLAGANVIMPNLSPKEVREKYMLYNNKLSSGLEAGEYINQLRELFVEVGYNIVVSRGDSLNI